MRLKRMVALVASGLFLLGLAGCGGKSEEVKPNLPPPRHEPPPRGPDRIALVEQPLVFQDTQEPIQTSATFEFKLPSRPRRCRLVMRYTGVAAALSEDYKMGHFRDKIELNQSFLMDLNTYSEAEDRVVEYTYWIHPGMLRGHNQLTFFSGDDGARDRTPKHDAYELRSAVLEFDW